MVKTIKIFGSPGTGKTTTLLNILEETGRVDIFINSFLNFYLVWNKGIGFGLLSSDQDFFYNVVTILIVLINFVFKRSK